MATRNNPSLQSLKTVLRCRDFQASFDFYTRILGLAVIDRWQEKDSTGCVLALPQAGETALLEISQIASESRRYRPSFSKPLTEEKIDLQIRTDDLDAWLRDLEGAWPFSGPKNLPWGGRWIKLRDPDNLLVAIYQDLA